jgi:hypothetical protein
MIPTLMQVRVKTSAGRRIGLWLPLFLLWVVVLLVSPLLLLALGFAALAGQPQPWPVLKAAWGVVNGLSGLDVDVKSEEADVLVRVW